MSRKSSEHEYSSLDDEEKLLLADIYPELKEKLERSVERSSRKRKQSRPAHTFVPISAFDASSDEEEGNVEDNEVMQIMSNTPAALEDLSLRTDDVSFYSAKSKPAGGDYMFSDDESPPGTFVADEQPADEMCGSYVFNPRFTSSFEEVNVESCEEAKKESSEEQVESGADQDGQLASAEESEDDVEDDSIMSIDRSFQPDAPMRTPPERRVLPKRSARNAHLPAMGGKTLRPPVRSPGLAEISPSYSTMERERKEDSEAEESFERYLRKVKEEDERKRKKEEEEEDDDEEEEAGKEREDSFVVSDDSVDVIDDDYENDSSDDDEDEEQEWKGSSSGDSSAGVSGGKENDKKKKKKKDARKDRLLDLADSFKSPSVSVSSKESRDPDRHFLLSLSEKYEGKRHEDAEPFIRRGVKGEKTRAALVQKLFELFNREIFDDKLPASMPITFNARLRKTAGYCKMSLRSGLTSIELSPKVCSKPERIRDTLAHELCHAAVFVVSRMVNERHGRVWKSWASRFAQRFNGFPVPERCHAYAIEAKFTYECEACGQQIRRHSKSLDTARKCCGMCGSKFFLRDQERITKRGANAFALYVKKNYCEAKRTGKCHREIMQMLSARFKESKEERREHAEAEEEPARREPLGLDLSTLSIHE